MTCQREINALNDAPAAGDDDALNEDVGQIL